MTAEGGSPRYLQWTNAVFCVRSLNESLNVVETNGHTDNESNYRGQMRTCRAGKVSLTDPRKTHQARSCPAARCFGRIPPWQPKGQILRSSLVFTQMELDGSRVLGFASSADQKLHQFDVCMNASISCIHVLCF